MGEAFVVVPIGRIRRRDGETRIEVAAAYAEALEGLEEFSHVVVCYWLDRNDTPEVRGRMKVHPRGDRGNPLTGVFATHSPRRPNPIAISICGILAIEGTSIRVDDIDAFDGSPVIDLKCYLPSRVDDARVRMPEWAAALNRRDREPPDRVPPG